MIIISFVIIIPSLATSYSIRSLNKSENTAGWPVSSAHAEHRCGFAARISHEMIYESRPKQLAVLLLILLFIIPIMIASLRADGTTTFDVESLLSRCVGP